MEHYFAEYVWLDSENNFRSKTKIISNKREDRFNISTSDVYKILCNINK